MPDLRKTRKKLKTALAVMAGVDLLALIVYFSPLVGSAETRRQELNRLQLELNIKTRQVAPCKIFRRRLWWPTDKLSISTRSASLPRILRSQPNLVKLPRPTASPLSKRDIK